MGNGSSRIRPGASNDVTYDEGTENTTPDFYNYPQLKKRSSVYQTKRVKAATESVQKNHVSTQARESIEIGIMTSPRKTPRGESLIRQFVDQSIQTDIDLKLFESMIGRSHTEESEKLLVDDDFVKLSTHSEIPLRSRFNNNSSMSRFSRKSSLRMSKAAVDRMSNSESEAPADQDHESNQVSKKKIAFNRMSVIRTDSGTFSIRKMDSEDYYAKPVVNQSLRNSGNFTRRSSQRDRYNRESIDNRTSKNLKNSPDSITLQRQSITIETSENLNHVSLAIHSNNTNTKSEAGKNNTLIQPDNHGHRVEPSLVDSDVLPLKERKVSYSSVGSVGSLVPSDSSQIISAYDYPSASDSEFTSDSSFNSTNNVSWTSTVRTGVEGDGTKSINEYVLLKRLGRGTFGKVKLCRNKISGQLYAIKIINRSLLNRVKKDKQGRPKKVDGIGDILKEVAILKKAEHPNVVKLFEVIDDPKNEKLFIIFEYIEQGPVLRMNGRDKLDCPPFDEDTARKYFRELITGLEYLHDNRIIHRDIKPENLLIDNTDTLKLTDFGVSHMLENDDDILYTSAGTPAFLPPEACMVGSYKGKPSDIWACGVTLYAMLFGRVPFTGSGILGVYNSIIHDTPQYPKDANPLAVDLLQKILDKNPDTRATIADIKAHKWVTNNGQYRFDKKCPLQVKVTEDEIKRAISKGEQLKMIDRFVMMSKMKRKLAYRAKLARQNLIKKKESMLDSSDQDSTQECITPRSGHSRTLNLNIDFGDQNRILQLNISQDGSTPEKKKQMFAYVPASDQSLILNSNRVKNSPQLSYKPVSAQKPKKFSYSPNSNHRNWLLDKNSSVGQE